VAVFEGRSVTKALRDSGARKVQLWFRPKQIEAVDVKPSNSQRKTQSPKGVFSYPPPVCAPARRPARLLGCLASPRLLASGHRHSASPVYPVSCLHLPGAGVPTQGTSHWGHPLGESNGEATSGFEGCDSLQGGSCSRWEWGVGTWGSGSGAQLLTSAAHV
jgi:hypothetical protein